jgi:hypothetical protein
MLKNYTPGEIALFEEKNKIGINVFFLGPNSHEETEIRYQSIFNDNTKVDVIDLGYLCSTDSQGQPISHFVIITKLNCLYQRKNYHHSSSYCKVCMKRISDSRYLLDHYQKYHLVDKFTPEIALPKEGYNIVKFDISDKHCFLKTKRKKFVCYTDFETLSKITTEELKKAGKSSKEIQQVVQQLPYAYAIFCPDLADLKGQTKKGKPIKLSESTYLKFGIDSDPDKLLRKFIDDLDIIYSCCLLRLDQHKDIPELTPDQ